MENEKMQEKLEKHRRNKKDKGVPIGTPILCFV